jgi:hypothetical protein
VRGRAISLGLRLQPQIDEPADGFGAAGQVFLLLAGTAFS